jgi:hypothetical protein
VFPTIGRKTKLHHWISWCCLVFTGTMMKHTVVPQ